MQHLLVFKFKADDKVENGGLNKVILKLWYKNCQNSLKTIRKMCDFVFHSFPSNSLQCTHSKVYETSSVYGLCFCTDWYVLLMRSVNTDRLSLPWNSRLGTASCFTLFLVKDYD